MIALFFMVQLLSFIQLSAADLPHPKKKRHYHKQMTFYDTQASPLRASQKSTSPRAAPYVGLQSKHNNDLQIYCHNLRTIARLWAISTSGTKQRLNAIVYVVRPKQERRTRTTT
jgi:hypothetical protein